MPELLDLYCKAGGTSKGYADAGFTITGVDIEPQKNYPFKFVCMDALEYLEKYGHLYDVIAASPPCQKYSVTSVLHPEIEYPDLIEPTRKLLINSGKSYVIENVVDAPLIKPIRLCGTQFGLKVYRHRLFESNLPIIGLPHKSHQDTTPSAGHGISPKGFISIAGMGYNRKYAEKAMDINWMSKNELSQAIPPAYTQFIGEQLMRFLTNGTKPIIRISVDGIMTFV